MATPMNVNANNENDKKITADFLLLDFDEFSRVWGIIDIPENLAVFRSGSKAPYNNTKPRWFSKHETSNNYKTLNAKYENYTCILKKGVKLMDLRVLKYLFQEYVAYNIFPSLNKDEIDLINKTMFALGLMPLADQLEYLHRNADPERKNNYFNFWTNNPNYASVDSVKNIIKCYISKNKNETDIDYSNKIKHYSEFGNRISDCKTDDIAAGLLKQIFGDTIDGYIAPKISSAWHLNFHPEICLFNPQTSIESCEVTRGSHIAKESIRIQNIISGANTVTGYVTKTGGSIEEIVCQNLKKTLLEDYISNITNDPEDDEAATKYVKKTWKTQ